MKGVKILLGLVICGLINIACSNNQKNDKSDKTVSGSDSVVVGSDSTQTKTEKICYGYISKEKISSILKADMYASDYDSLGECDYKKVNTDDPLKGTQVRINIVKGRDWYDKQKKFFSKKDDFVPHQGFGDDAFASNGKTTIYVLKDGYTWFINLYTGDENLVPEITVLNKNPTPGNEEKLRDHKLMIVKELTRAVIGK